MVSFFDICLFPERRKKRNKVGELQERINTDSKLVILDVRTPKELIGPLG